jgi:hypothetical protein
MRSSLNRRAFMPALCSLPEARARRCAGRPEPESGVGLDHRWGSRLFVGLGIAGEGQGIPGRRAGRRGVGGPVSATVETPVQLREVESPRRTAPAPG